MSTRLIPRPPSNQSPDVYRPENFRKKATLRDYAIYAVVLVLLAGLIGGAVYFFTRSEQEQAALLAKVEKLWNKPVEKEALPALKAPKLGGLMGEENTETPAPPPAPPVPVRKTEAKLVNVSIYSGGGPKGVFFSDDPAQPKASLEFVQFAETLKASGVLQGTPAKVMLNGRLFRAGQVIEHDLGVTFAGLDEAKKHILLRDQSGAELRLAY